MTIVLRMPVLISPRDPNFDECPEALPYPMQLQSSGRQVVLDCTVGWHLFAQHVVHICLLCVGFPPKGFAGTKHNSTSCEWKVFPLDVTLRSQFRLDTTIDTAKTFFHLMYLADRLFYPEQSVSRLVINYNSSHLALVARDSLGLLNLSTGACGRWR